MVAVQKDVLAGFGLLAKLQSVLQVNSNALTFEAGGFIELEVFAIGRMTNITTITNISIPNMIIINVEIGSPCPFI
jgi:hypothetical protein